MKPFQSRNVPRVIVSTSAASTPTTVKLHVGWTQSVKCSTNSPHLHHVLLNSNRHMAPALQRVLAPTMPLVLKVFSKIYKRIRHHLLLSPPAPPPPCPRTSCWSASAVKKPSLTNLFPSRAPVSDPRLSSDPWWALAVSAGLLPLHGVQIQHLMNF